MSLRQQRNEISKAILEGRFVKRTLEREGKELLQDIDKTMSAAGFRSDIWDEKGINVVGSGSTLEYRHRKENRFVDIRTRNTKDGKKRKKNYRIHNRKIYGRLNDIARELSFGFTEAIIGEMKELQD